jgi:hypothetical protein
MKLVTEEIEKLLEKYPWKSQEYEEDPIALVKFFTNYGRGEWYVLEAQKLENDDYLFHGWVKSPLGADCDELGPFTLSELQSISIPIEIVEGLVDTIHIERDVTFEPKRLSKIKAEA